MTRSHLKKRNRHNFRVILLSVENEVSFESPFPRLVRVNRSKRIFKQLLSLSLASRQAARVIEAIFWGLVRGIRVFPAQILETELSFSRIVMFFTARGPN